MLVYMPPPPTIYSLHHNQRLFRKSGLLCQKTCYNNQRCSGSWPRSVCSCNGTVCNSRGVKSLVHMENDLTDVLQIFLSIWTRFLLFPPTDTGSRPWCIYLSCKKKTKYQTKRNAIACLSTWNYESFLWNSLHFFLLLVFILFYGNHPCSHRVPHRACIDQYGPNHGEIRGATTMRIKTTVKSRHNAHHRANAHPPFQRQKSCKGVIFLLVIAQSVYF